MFSSGSGNHAMRAPLGKVQIPSASCSSRSYLAKTIPATARCFISTRDIGNLPARNSKLRRIQFADVGDAQHDSVYVEDEGEGILFDQREAECIAVKSSCPRGIQRADERHHLCVVQHQPIVVY